MKIRIKLIIGAFLFSSTSLFSQLNANGGYLIGNQVEVGIHNHGHEGTFDLVGSNSRTNSTSEVYFGFVANPQNDGWNDYDGDFFTPGSPENGFGLEINGTNYSNNGVNPFSFFGLQYEIPGSLSNYQQIGNCISVQWDGSINNVAIQLVYSLNITELYYTTEVTITNNTGATLNDVYYYRNLDPDNNQQLNTIYDTQNTIVAQPVPGCEKALVSATQNTPWLSYIGLAAVGANFRVSYGGFSNRDASDIWNGTGGLTGTVGSSLYDDVAISLAYKIPTLAAGASENFQFGVILDQNQIDAALASFYFFDYTGGSGSPSFCVPVVDTVFTCAGNPTTISIEGPNTAGYNWTWTPPTDLSVTTGTTTQASPNSTTTYTVTGTPAGGGCLTGQIIKNIVVDLAAGPEAEIVDPGTQCGSFDLNTLVVNDINNIPGTTIGFFGVIPDSATQVAGTWPSNLISDGEIVYVMIADPISGCFSVQQVIIDFGGSGAAGADSTLSLCNIPGTVFDLDNFLSPGVATGTWSETSAPNSGQLNTTTAVFNTTALAGTYTVNYFVPGALGCPDDNALMTINLYAVPAADFEYIVDGLSSANGLTSVCITNPIDFDNNSFVFGGGGAITSNTWTFGDGNGSSASNPTYQYSTPGNYTINLTVTTNQGCTSNHSLPITITNAPTMAITVGEPSCYLFTDGSITINTSGGGPYTYIITNASGTQINALNTNTVNQIGTGWYYLNVDDGAGCAGIDSVFVNQPDQLNIDLIVTQPLCFGFNTGAALVDTVYNYTGAYNQISYFWNPNPNGTNGIGQNSTTQLGPGGYALTINDVNGCSRVFDFTITYPDELVFTELGTHPAYCRLYSYQSGHGVVYAAASGSGQNDSYLWTNLQTGATTNNTTWGGLNPGHYQILYTNSSGCTNTEAVTVDSLNPLADFEMTSPQFTSNYEGTAPVNVHFVNQSLYFANPNNPGADTTFFWNFNYDNSNWIISHDLSETFDSTYGIGGIYDVCLVAINKNGCTDTLCKKLVIYDPLIFVPINIFSPDGDGVNDEFSFDFRADAVSEFRCVIVNRWGVVITELNNITDTWNGTDRNGDKCQDGVYFYSYTGRADNSTPFEGQGTIQIVNSH